jgi:hypothetical protein
MGCHDRIFKTGLLILSSDLEMEWVVAKGQRMVQGNEILIKGTFEDEA